MLQDEDKLRDREDIDKIIWAEIPDKNIYPLLYEKVTKHMIHGPCCIYSTLMPGFSCINDQGVCLKKFPKEFQEETIVNTNGYPKYQRQAISSPHIITGKAIDNRWVVPYNPVLLQEFNCHINVESCTSVKSIKYIYKYIHK